VLRTGPTVIGHLHKTRSSRADDRDLRHRKQTVEQNEHEYQRYVSDHDVVRDAQPK
jgi:hypothetical protein